MKELLGICLAAALGWRISAGVATSGARLGLSLGIGFGISSLAYFWGLLWLGKSGPGCLSLELILLVGLLGRKPDTTMAGTPSPAASTPKWLWLLFALSQLVAILSLAYRQAHHPHGDWDAYAVWNCRARFLYRGGFDWRCAFGEPWSNPDYPLLLPGAVVRLWTLSGGDGPLAPMLVAASYGFAIQILLVGWLWQTGRTSAALMAGCMLPLPGFLEQVSALYADVPLSFFVLAVPLLLRRHPGLAGLCAGLGAWTKNEGLLLILWGVLWLCLSRRGKDLVRFGLGSLPGLATLVAFKVSLNLFGLSWLGSSQDLSHLADGGRILLIFQEMLYRCFGGGGLCSLHGLLWAGVVLVGLRRGARLDDESRCCYLFLLATAISYAFLYWITPFPLVWHLETSLDRLLLHLWPLSLWSAMRNLSWN